MRFLFASIWRVSFGPVDSGNVTIQINFQLEESIALFTLVHLRLAHLLMNRLHVILMTTNAGEGLQTQFALNDSWCWSKVFKIDPLRAFWSIAFIVGLSWFGGENINECLISSFTFSDHGLDVLHELVVRIFIVRLRLDGLQRFTILELYVNLRLKLISILSLPYVTRPLEISLSPNRFVSEMDCFGQVLQATSTDQSRHIASIELNYLRQSFNSKHLIISWTKQTQRTWTPEIIKIFFAISPSSSKIGTCSPSPSATKQIRHSRKLLVMSTEIWFRSIIQIFIICWYSDKVSFLLLWKLDKSFAPPSKYLYIHTYQDRIVILPKMAPYKCCLYVPRISIRHL